MTITLSFTWWLIPTIITVISAIWGFWPVNDPWEAFASVFFMVPVLIVNVLAWMIAAFCK